MNKQQPEREVVYKLQKIGGKLTLVLELYKTTVVNSRLTNLETPRMKKTTAPPITISSRHSEEEEIFTTRPSAPIGLTSRRKWLEKLDIVMSKTRTKTSTWSTILKNEEERLS